MGRGGGGAGTMHAWRGGGNSFTGRCGCRRGPHFLVDAVEPAASEATSVARSETSDSPVFIADFSSSSQPDAVAIRVQARADCCVEESSGIDVAITDSLTSFSSATKLATNIAFSSPGESVVVYLPPGTSPKMVVVQKPGNGVVMALQTVELLTTSERCPMVPNGAKWCFQACVALRCGFVGS